MIAVGFGVGLWIEGNDQVDCVGNGDGCVYSCV